MGGEARHEVNEPEAALLPQTGAVEALVDQSQAGDGNARPVPVQTGGVISAPATSAGQVAVASPATNITQFHRHNAETHFLNSKGLPRLKACQNPEACGGSHRALCFSCSVANDGPAYSDGAA